MLKLSVQQGHMITMAYEDVQLNTNDVDYTMAKAFMLIQSYLYQLQDFTAPFSLTMGKGTTQETRKKEADNILTTLLDTLKTNLNFEELVGSLLNDFLKGLLVTEAKFMTHRADKVSACIAATNLSQSIVGGIISIAKSEEGFHLSASDIVSLMNDLDTDLDISHYETIKGIMNSNSHTCENCS